jgi:hypothetical protein
MPVGGKREGAGRPKGAVNKKTAEKIEAIEASGLTPLDYMLSVLRDESRAEHTRMDAAKAAAPYVHARLSNVDQNTNHGGTVHIFETVYERPDSAD